MPRFACLVAIALVCLATALRRTVRRNEGFAAVDALYTWGSPASATPGLTNLHGSDPCFPGLRTVTIDGNWKMDIIPKLARYVNYKHPLMALHELDTNEWTNASKYHACSAEAARMPRGRIGSLFLHMPWEYTGSLQDHQSFLFNISFIGCWLSNAKDFPILGDRVKEGIESVGWKLVARAFAPASFLQGGDQYSILTQHPDTLECMVTFQSTLSAKDVLADMDFRERAFCELPGTVVHKGFRDQLRRMVSGEWQQLVRPHLPGCSKVLIAGMSLGGAMAELFTACVNRAPAGDVDFANFSWSKGQAKQLPYV